MVMSLINNDSKIRRSWSSLAVRSIAKSSSFISCLVFVECSQINECVEEDNGCNGPLMLAVSHFLACSSITASTCVRVN